jgi:hypothetical protein
MTPFGCHFFDIIASNPATSYGKNFPAARYSAYQS